MEVFLLIAAITIFILFCIAITYAVSKLDSLEFKLELLKERVDNSVHQSVLDGRSSNDIRRVSGVCDNRNRGDDKTEKQCEEAWEEATSKH